MQLWMNAGLLKFQNSASPMTIAGAVGSDAWHSVAVVSTGTAYVFYVDGSVSSQTTSGNGNWLADIANRDNISIGAAITTSAWDSINGKMMQVAYWGGASGTTGVLDADAIGTLHAAGKSYDIKSGGDTGKGNLH